MVFTNKASHNSGVGIINCRVSAADTLAIQFMNVSGAPVTPAAESWLVFWVRGDNVIGGVAA